MHQAYIIRGVVDASVIHKQAHKRANDDRYPEPTAVHYHKHGEPCNEQCYLVKVGEVDEGPKRGGR
jgi:hypothetical protein